MDQATESILSGQPTSIATAPAAAPAPVIPAVAPAAPTSATPALEPGKPVAPDTSQAGTPPAAPVTPAAVAPATGEQAPAAVTDEQLLAAAGLTESPDKKLSRLERDHSASSKEARRLLDYSNGLENALKEQGIDIAKDEHGKPVGLIAGKKYSKDIAGLDIKVGDLPDEIQALFETDQQKVVDFIADKARKAMTKVAPTLAQAAALPLSPERHETAIQYLTDMKWETGDVKFPGLAANRKLIEQMINAPSCSKALKEFHNQEPETALALLNLQLDHARSHITEQGKKAAEALATKKAANDTNPQPQPAGGGTPTIGGAPAGDLASQVAHAPLGLY